MTSLANVRMFYGNLPGCPEGRSSDSWADFDFHGHHFGVVLSMDARKALAERSRATGTRFVIEPPIRFEGQPGGEQATMFLLDPCGNALEFKAFADRAQLFAK